MLKHLAAFQEVLHHYHVSDESKKILAQTKLALMVAPTASGRNTLIKELLKTGDYHFIVSDTTRQPRVNDGVPEKNGVEYWFRNEEDILADLKAGNFLEAAIIHNQQVSGISIRELGIAHQEGKIATTDIEVVGVHNIMLAKPDALAIFVLPPSFEAWMSRIDKRGDMKLGEKRRRLQSAMAEFKAALDNEYYVFVVNDTVSHAVDQIQELTHETVDNKEQKQDRQLVEELMAKTKEWLNLN